MKKLISLFLTLVILLGALPIASISAKADYNIGSKAYAEPLSATVKLSTTFASTYSTIKATAYASGGRAPYLYAFYVYKDGAVAYKGAYTTSYVFNYMPRDPGRYDITAFVRDSLGRISAVQSKTILVVGSSTPPLFVLPSISRTSMLMGDSVAVSAKASGGAGGPYKYAFYIHKDTHLIYRGNYTTSNVLNYKPTGVGAYKFTAFAMDRYGNRIGRSTKILSVLPAPKYRALVIGQSVDSDPKGNLPAAKFDADRMNTKFLTKGPFGPMIKVTKRDNLTGRQILSTIPAAFVGADENSVSIFCFSGHGSNEGHITGVDTGWQSYVWPDELARELKKIPGKIIVIMMTCFSGYHINRSVESNLNAEDFNKNFIKAFEAENVYEKSPGQMATPKFHVITSSSMNTVSYGFGNESGPFTGSWFINGILKAQDSNNDGFISMHEAYIAGRNEIYRVCNTYYNGGNMHHAQCYPYNDQLKLWKK